MHILKQINQTFYTCTPTPDLQAPFRFCAYLIFYSILIERTNMSSSN